MLLCILAYLGGALTIVSPCILPVLPFVFARAGQPFVRSGLPMLAGLAITFAGVANLAAVGGGWAVQANGYGRIAALVVLGFFGLLLLLPSLAEQITRPLVALGARLSESARLLFPVSRRCSLRRRDVVRRRTRPAVAQLIHPVLVHQRNRLGPFSPVIAAQ